MKTAAVICEYNPFHYGHRHQLEQTRALGATHIVAVMSGDFTQRGDLAEVYGKGFASQSPISAPGQRPRSKTAPTSCWSFP